MVQALEQGLIDGKAQGIADATGLSADGRSSYYAQKLMRSKGDKYKKTKQYKIPKWPKINAIIHAQSHLIVSAIIDEGPSHDSPALPGLLKQASRRLHFDILLADSGYDSEEHHRLARQDYKIRSSVIALNPRNQGRRWPMTKYRRQMKRRFPRHVYNRRSQVESVWSRKKRRLGWVLSSKSKEAQELECQNKVLTYNLMILAFG